MKRELQITRIIELVGDGFSPWEIIFKLGITRASVLQIIGRAQRNGVITPADRAKLSRHFPAPPRARH